MTESKQAKHTPGPWRIGDAGHTVFGPPTGEPAPKIVASGLTRSNAILIRSAPDLLADNDRLRSQLAKLQEALETVSNWSGDFTTGESVYDYAGAALADTDGGSDMRFMLIRSHHEDIPHFVKLPDSMPLYKAAEMFQADLRKRGRPDGVSYKLHEGDWVSAMIEARTV